MPQTPHIEQHFTASETVRDVVIGMSDGTDDGIAGAGRSNALIPTDEMARVSSRPAP